MAGVLVLLAVGACSAEEGASSRTPDAPVVVVSSISEGDELAGQTTWDATVTLHGVVHVRRVEFVVDDKVRWTQTSPPPYRFSVDGRLSSWVLGPGEHELVVRVVPNPGTPVETSSLVTVAERPSGSAALAGEYERTVTEGDGRAVLDYRTPATGASGSPPPTGRWRLAIGALGEMSFTDPTGFRSGETYTASGQRFRVHGPAYWLGDPEQPAQFCSPEKPADYTWERRGTALVVLAVDRTCADRDQVLVGTWTRTG